MYSLFWLYHFGSSTWVHLFASPVSDIGKPSPLETTTRQGTWLLLTDPSQFNPIRVSYYLQDYWKLVCNTINRWWLLALQSLTLCGQQTYSKRNKRCKSQVTAVPYLQPLQLVHTKVVLYTAYNNAIHHCAYILVYGSLPSTTFTGNIFIPLFPTLVAELRFPKYTRVWFARFTDWTTLCIFWRQDVSTTRPGGGNRWSSFNTSGTIATW